MYGNLPGGGIPPASAATGTMLANTGFPLTGAIIAATGLLITGILLLRTKYILNTKQNQTN